METATEVEEITNRIYLALQGLDLSERTYQPGENQINLVVIVGGKKILIKVKGK